MRLHAQCDAAPGTTPFRAIDIGWFSRIGSTNAKSEAARARVYCHSQSEQWLAKFAAPMTLVFTR
jgi:hypothetical protein